uniref:hypothetical protein n=1 Tax=Polaribacter sp. TaxID=1920175 RepID=UPI004047A59A
MSLKKYFIFFLLSTTLGVSKLNGQAIENKYTEYFKQTREIPYLHLNKTNFIEGEEVWFQAYVLNQKTSKLHQHTTNLYCHIYNENSEYKQSKLLYVKNGIASNSFKIDESFTENTYYIKATTNWMKNFEEDDSFTQKIHIVSNNTAKASIQNTESYYDLQLLPEGGHLVANTNAVVGLLIKDKKNKGVQIKSGFLLKADNTELQPIAVNQFGLGKINFFYEQNSRYKVKITTFDDEVIVKDIEPAKDHGISLQVDNLNTAIIQLKIKTNATTLKMNKGAKFYLFIHNTNSLSKHSFVLKEEATEYEFFLSAKKLPKGINIITILNEDEYPILERLIFNYDKEMFASIDTKILSKSRDSLSLQLSKNNDQIHYLSASFLPEETQSYETDNNLITKLLLKPFVKGTIENSTYYFKDTNRKKLVDLDLLLLNQGWSRYNWNTVFNRKPNFKFEFEKGITVSGTMKSKVKDSTVLLLFSPKSELVLNTSVVNNQFTFDHIYLKDSSEVNFSIQGNRRLKVPSISSTFYPILNKKDTTFSKTFSVNVNADLKDFISDRIVLDEVTLQLKPKEKNRPTRLFATSTRYKNTDPFYIKSRNILSFLATKGFQVTGSFPFTVISNNRGISNFRQNQGAATEVTLDDIPIVTQEFNNLNFISNMTLDDFEEIIISKNDGGQIYLYSNKEKRNLSEDAFQKVISPIGFASEKTYYTPNYNTSDVSAFKKYAAIFWKPNMVFEQKNYTFSVPHFNQKNIRLFIEGITKEGAIIYEEKVLSLE